MNPPDKESVKSYYDERVEGKLADFTGFNPRIEAAVLGIAAWAPPEPRRILEIGCGIGATSWRMARAWMAAEVLGIDVSPRSIKVAKTCFQLPNLTYRQGVVAPGTVEGSFDLIVLMDVYEHIAPSDRAALHEAIRSLLSNEGRVFFSVPTPTCLQFARKHNPDGIQPVDEDIDPAQVLRVCAETRTDLLYYRELGIWHYGDYAHFVCGRVHRLCDVHPSYWCSPAGFTLRLRSYVRSLLGGDTTADYELGPPPLAGCGRFRADRFRVVAGQRRVLAERWLARR